MQFTINNLKQIVTPGVSQDFPAEHPPAAAEIVLVQSSSPIEVRKLADMSALTESLKELALRLNMSIQELVRGGHVVVFYSPPLKLVEKEATLEVEHVR